MLPNKSTLFYQTHCGGGASYLITNNYIDKVAKGASYCWADFATINKIDITNYNKIVLKGNIKSNPSEFNFGISDSVSSAEQPMSSWNKCVKPTVVGDFEIELDISSFNGEKYIVIAIGYSSATINEIKMFE